MSLSAGSSAPRERGQPDPFHRIPIQVGALGAHLPATFAIVVKGAVSVSVEMVTGAMDLAPAGLLSVAAPVATSQVKAAMAANLDTLKQVLETL
jgi:hypothetical protein